MIDPANHFETHLTQLKQLVENMENGALSLEEALKHYEQGISLIRTCQEQLKHAEQTVQRLQQQNGEETLVPFESV